MAEISKKYQEIIKELEKRITNADDLRFIKEKFSELAFCYIDSINMLVEIEKKQNAIDRKIKKIQNDIDNIEEDIYIDQEDRDNNSCENESCEECNEYDEDDYLNENGYEFEIRCPYCDHEFVTDESSKGKSEITCPKCHKAIELDWDDAEECDGECMSCNHACYQNEHMVAENYAAYKRENPSKQNKAKNNQTLSENEEKKADNKKEENNDDDM